MATPLSLYVPIKQDSTSQSTAQTLYANFVALITPILTTIDMVHFARFVLIPNLQTGTGINSILLITTFDGAMNPYLSTFWTNGDGLHTIINEIAGIALTPPAEMPITTLNGFENFVNGNNLSQPSDLYESYSDTVPQVLAYNAG